MSEVTALTCSHCGAPTAFLAAHCSYCNAPLAWHGVPELGAGALVRAFDFKRGQLLPGMELVRGVAIVEGRGAVVSIDALRTVFVGADELRRDVALTLIATALDEGVGFGIEFRSSYIGKRRTAYVAKVMPHLRAYRVERTLNLDPGVEVDVLRAPETVAAIPGVGQSTTLEVRCADSVISVRAQGVHLGSFVDARYGLGDHGWSVSGYHRGGRVLLERFEIRKVG
jgi:hypothetical protein